MLDASLVVLLELLVAVVAHVAEVSVEQLPASRAVGQVHDIVPPGSDISRL